MNNFLTNKQIIFIIYCITIGYGIINLPKNAAETAGTGMWFTLLITTVIFMAIVYMITYLQYVYEGETLYEYGKRLVGKSITYFFMIILLMYFMINFSMIIRLYGEIIKLTILFRTPVASLCLLFFMVIGYALTKGPNVIARICEIYGLLNLLGFIFINTLLITKGRLVNIQPLFVKENLPAYIKAVPQIALPFLGAEALLFLPLSRTKNKNILKYTTLMVGFIGLFYIYVSESTVSVIGVDAVVYLKESLLSVVRGVDIQYLEILRRLDGIYIIFWTMNIVCAISLWGYGITTFTNKIIKKAKYNYIAIAVTITAFILSQIPKTKDQTESIIKYNSYIGMIASTVIPGILLVITKVKKYDKHK